MDTNDVVQKRVCVCALSTTWLPRGCFMSIQVFGRPSSHTGLGPTWLPTAIHITILAHLLSRQMLSSLGIKIFCASRCLDLDLLILRMGSSDSANHLNRLYCADHDIYAPHLNEHLCLSICQILKNYYYLSCVPRNYIYIFSIQGHHTVR